MHGFLNSLTTTKFNPKIDSKNKYSLSLCLFVCEISEQKEKRHTVMPRRVCFGSLSEGGRRQRVLGATIFIFWDLNKIDHKRFTFDQVSQQKKLGFNEYLSWLCQVASQFWFKSDFTLKWIACLIFSISLKRSPGQSNPSFLWVFSWERANKQEIDLTFLEYFCKIEPSSGSSKRFKQTKNQRAILVSDVKGKSWMKKFKKMWNCTRVRGEFCFWCLMQ